jgi:hypothetical protein
VVKYFHLLEAFSFSRQSFFPRLAPRDPAKSKSQVQAAMIRSYQIKCPTCKGNVAMRVNRNGFMQRRVLTYFGYYPWKCGACGASFLYRSRGHDSAGSDDGSRSGGPAAKHGRAA